MTFFNSISPINFTPATIKEQQLVGSGILIPQSTSTEPFDSIISKCQCKFNLNHFGSVVPLIKSKETTMIKGCVGIWYNGMYFQVRCINENNSYNLYAEIYQTDSYNKTKSKTPINRTLISSYSSDVTYDNIELFCDTRGTSCIIVNKKDKTIKLFNGYELTYITNFVSIRHMRQTFNVLCITFSDTIIKTIIINISNGDYTIYNNTSDVLISSIPSILSSIDSITPVEFKQHSFKINGNECIYDIDNVVTNIKDVLFDGKMTSIWVQTDTKLFHFMKTKTTNLKQTELDSLISKKVIYDGYYYKNIGYVNITSDYSMFVDKEVVDKFLKNICIFSSTQITYIPFFSDKMDKVTKPIIAPTTSYNMLCRQFPLTVINPSKYNTIVKDLLSKSNISLDINKSKMYMCIVEAIPSKSINLKKVNGKLMYECNFTYICINTFKIY